MACAGGVAGGAAAAAQQQAGLAPMPLPCLSYVPPMCLLCPSYLPVTVSLLCPILCSSQIPPMSLLWQALEEWRVEQPRLLKSKQGLLLCPSHVPLMSLPCAFYVPLMSLLLCPSYAPSYVPLKSYLSPPYVPTVAGARGVAGGAAAAAQTRDVTVFARSNVGAIDPHSLAAVDLRA